MGVVVSAFLTPKLISDGRLYRGFYYGVVMVISVIVATFTNELWITVALLFIIGMMGGMFVVPLNTILQEEGKATVGSGRTIAVQNFCGERLNGRRVIALPDVYRTRYIRQSLCYWNWDCAVALYSVLSNPDRGHPSQLFS